MTQPKTNVLLKIDSTPLSASPLVLRTNARTFRRGITLPTTGPRPKLYATGGTGGYVFSIENSSAYDGLPPGVTLNATTGLFSGTPTAVGRYRFRAKVQDSSATVAEEDFTIDVIGQLIVRNGTPVDGEVSVPYSYRFEVTGNTGTVQWSLVSGTLPASLSISSFGVLSGTPSADGVSYFVVRAEDLTTGDPIDIVCRITMYPELQMFITPTLHYATVGEPFIIDASIPTGNFNGSATGVGPWKYLVGTGSDSWITIDSNGIITGTAPASAISPTVAGVPIDTINFTYQVVDALGVTVSNSILGGVIPNGQAPLQPQKNGSDVGSPGPAKFNLVEGANVSITASNDGTTVTYEISSTGGSGGGVETVNGIVPDSSGNVSITIPTGGVESVNGVGPDSSGNVQIPIPPGVGAVNGVGPDSSGNVEVIRTPGCVFDNAGIALSGTLTSEIQIPYAATISAWTIAGDVAGSASIVVSHSTYAAYDTMTTLFTATCTTAKKAQATGLSYALAAGDILRFSGSGFSAFTRCSIVLEAA